MSDEVPEPQESGVQPYVPFEENFPVIQDQDPGIPPYLTPTDPVGGTAYDDNGNLNPGWEIDGEGVPFYAGFPKAQRDVATDDDAAFGAAFRANEAQRAREQYESAVEENDAAVGAAYRAQRRAEFEQTRDNEEAENGRAMSALLAKTENARNSQTVTKQLGTGASSNDWRFRITLAKGANYLYNDSKNTLLRPLYNSGGVIFPYLPSVSTSYKANYSPYDLTHSNYKGYFYSNSAVEAVSVKGLFTAQNFQEAKYLLAVIHFFKSATKMFYGARDPNAGSPPPILYMTGFGEYQFNNHPVVLSSFEYSLPTDVDYIRTTIPQDNINRQVERNRSNTVYSSQFAGLIRLGTALNIFGQPLSKGAVFTRPNVARTSSVATYVPTKIDISLTFLPVQSRKQVSQEFNMQEFANGDLIKKGFW